MLLPIRGNSRPARLAVLAYDIGCPRRARRVRRLLDSIYIAKQYSVYEVLLPDREFNGLLAEIDALCDFGHDKFVVWWPRDGLRFCWDKGRLIVGARLGLICMEPADRSCNAGNFVICYDISDPDVLDAVASAIAPVSVMLQRSVYWLRGPQEQLAMLFSRCAAYMTDMDRLWGYPLSGSHALWHVGNSDRSILPIATYRW